MPAQESNFSDRESEESSDEDDHPLLSIPALRISTRLPSPSNLTTPTSPLSPTSTVPTDYSSDRDDLEPPPPLVLVAGFLAPSWKANWGPLEELQELAIREEASKGRWLGRRKFLYVTPGMCSSVHDRACEIFAQLKGGIVDYGEVHSREVGHERYGRTYEVSHHPGLYPQWSATHPLHFLGHSLGGPTIYKLQEFLATGFFAPAGHPDTSVDWIRSLTGLSAPFRGTTACYLLGLRPYPHPPGAVYPLSFGGVAYRTLHLYEYFVPESVRRAVYDLQLDHWNFPTHGLWKCLWRSPWAEGLDTAPYDLCVGARWRDWERMTGSESWEKGEWRGVGQRTWYRSFATSLAIPSLLLPPFPAPTSLPKSALSLAISLPLYLLSLLVSRHRFVPGTSAVPPAELAAARTPFSIDPHFWHDNDGLCCVVGQYHPGACRRCGGWDSRAPFLGEDGLGNDTEGGDNSLPCLHRRSLGSRYARYGDKGPDRAEDESKSENEQTENPGVWYVTELAGATHLDLGLWHGSGMQKAFWADVIKWLGKVDGWAERAE
ncbi:hypothetical protein BC938DRAFT_481996 [Jimgerdemannia flammicorona]|uniref:Lipase-like C-terminal domain-containing protein n=1 Tax=Jimgerdemannia flammicorona TaxID=994334 RepID=A0A433QFF8_9FUNG|nr:hypothetical protein BC938DRAFT_481996 [Jimgerdemannia flammicorona]